jgi:cellulose synthase/poly-beta-1,6-N-acetylglucosamine synthase-like glycosyltransferase
VSNYAKKDMRVKLYVEEERKGKASAINIVLKNAKGDEILFVQADTMPGKGCFGKLITKIQNPNIGLVCAHPQTINNSSELPSKLGKVLWSLHDKVFKQFNIDGQARHASEVFCVRKDITSSIPSETVNDDAYIALAAKKKGWKVCYESESYVSIYGPETMSDYIKQRRRVIYGHYQIKKMTGENPQYFMSLLFLNRNMKKNLIFLFLSEFELPTLMAFIGIEIVLNAISLSDLARGKSYRIWSTATSTKKGLN